MAKKAAAASASSPPQIPSSKGKGPATAATAGLDGSDSQDAAGTGTTADGTGGYTTTTGLPEIRVNKWALGELKTACDDAVKQLLSQPSPSAFRANNVHLDVRLALGWSASLIAFAAAYHAYRHPSFQETRPWVLAGVVSFVLLGAAMNTYARWVEGNVIYQGKRKVFAAGRIETQSLTVSTSCEAHIPVYHLAMSYTHSTNGGKSLLKQFDRDVTKPFGELFDEEGRLARSELEKLVIGVLEEAESVGR